MAMKYYTPEQKEDIILQSFKDSRSISELCRTNNISPITFSRWKKAYLAGGHEALRTNKKNFMIEIERENAKLKEVVGHLYTELHFIKKNEARE